MSLRGATYANASPPKPPISTTIRYCALRIFRKSTPRSSPPDNPPTGISEVGVPAVAPNWIEA